MTKYWARVLEGTIFPQKKEKKKVSFLDPWTSLLPSFIKKKLAPDILAVFTPSKAQINGRAKLAQVKLPFWALVFPKRTYLPPDYPHLQLWFLGSRFAPSISFVDPAQRRLLGQILAQLDSIFENWRQQNQKLKFTDQVLAINATPFSFIKNPTTGEYYWGGQSVRTFHLHFLLIPQKLKKTSVAKARAALVYPTQFSQQLFELILTAKGLKERIFGSRLLRTKITRRGIKFVLPNQSKIDLISILTEIDRIFYHLQLRLIAAFYQDGPQFLNKLTDFLAVGELEKLESKGKELILLGKERPLTEIRLRLKQALSRLGKDFGLELSLNKIRQLTQLLTIDEKGDLASWLDDQPVVLRPGMGYGTFVKKKKTRLIISLVPLDSLLAEGVMESSGYLFVRKIKVNRRPNWLKEVVLRLDQSFHLARKEEDR